MFKELLSLHREEDTAGLIAALKDVSTKQMNDLMSDSVGKSRGDPGNLLRALIAGVPCDVSTSTQKRLSLYKHCINLLHNDDLTAKVVADLIGILMAGVDDFPSPCLAELCSHYVENIKNGETGKLLELFPKVLSSVDMQDSVVCEGGEMTGTAYKSHIINSLCSGRWDGSTVLSLAAMFKEVDLKPDELKLLLSKIIRMMEEMELQEIPPLVYQMLLLSTKGHKSFVLEGIISHFIQQDHAVKILQVGDHDLTLSSMSPDQLAVIEGTTILHITFAFKQDQELGRQFLKYLKAEQQSSTSKALAPFSLALALSCSKIHRFEEQVIDFLKGAILKNFKDIEKQEKSKWAAEMIGKVDNVTPHFMDTIKSSVHGWDHVVQGLVQLGFTLMDSFGPKAAFGRITEVNHVAAETPTQKACKLGANILLETFQTHEMVRSDILQQILNRVVTKATAPVTHYLELLSDTVMAAPQILLDSVSKLREAFDYLSCLPPPTAHALLRAVQPLLKISMSLKDALLLVLRKAMFSRQTEARQTAVQGFLLILKHFKVLGGIPYSQASQATLSASQHSTVHRDAIQVDVHIPYNAANNEGVCLEVLGNLRRCLTQQADVRMTLYGGLFDVLCRNTQLAGPILSTLHQQVQRYYQQQTDVNPPVKLEPCISLQGDDVYTQEPLAHLICCIVQCFLKVRSLDSDQLDEEEKESIEKPLEDMLESMTTRMVKSELEDFELDRSADFSLSTGVGIRNNIYVMLVSGIYEVLMEYTFITGELEIASCETVLALYKGYRKISDILRDKPAAGGATGGKRGRPEAGKSTTGNSGSKQKSLLSLGLLKYVIKSLYNNSHPDHQVGLACLRGDLDFQRYILTTTLHHVTQISQTGTCDGPEGHEAKKLQKYCATIAKVLQKYYTEQLESSEDDRREKSKQLSVLATEILSVIFTVMCTVYRDSLIEFLCYMEGVQNDGDRNIADITFEIIKKLQGMVITVISGEDDNHSVKEATSLLSIIRALVEPLGVHSDRAGEILNWIKRLCTEQTIDDVPLVRLLVSQMLELATLRGSCVQLCREVAKDIHSQLGDIDTDVSLDQTSAMSVISPRTSAPTLLLLLLTHINQELDTTGWVLNHLRVGGPDSSNDANETMLTQKEATEKSLCNRLGHLVNTFHELCQSAIPVGTCVENALRVMGQLFNTLTNLVKYYLQLYNKGQSHLTSRFEKLVKLSGTNLTTYVYSMITYLQATTNEALQQATNKAKKDKKKQDLAAILGKNKVMKESKSIPQLIFVMEQYEKFLIQLSKKSKVNLMDHFKMSTARDFRINVASLEEAMEEGEDETDLTNMDETNHSGDENDTTEHPEPSAKRSKVAKSQSKGLKGKLTKKRGPLKKKNS